jgi:hypothetical protein
MLYVYVEWRSYCDLEALLSGSIRHGNPCSKPYVWLIQHTRHFQRFRHPLTSTVLPLTRFKNRYLGQKYVFGGLFLAQIRWIYRLCYLPSERTQSEV